MRTLTEKISSSVNEARELEYRVSLSDFKDKDGIQINTDQLLNCFNFEVHAVRNLDYNGVPY